MPRDGAMLKAVLVDMDGTLVNTAAANAAAYAEALEEQGIAVDPAALAARIDGRHWRDFLPGLLAARPDVAPEAVAVRKRALYPRYFDRIKLNGALADMLGMLRPQVRTALVTTASGAAVAGVLGQFGLRELFDELVCGDDVARAKPHPDAYVLAAGRLGVSPGECLVIEDSDTGMEAARAFGAGILRWSGPG